MEEQPQKSLPSNTDPHKNHHVLHPTTHYDIKLEESNQSSYKSTHKFYEESGNRMKMMNNQPSDIDQTKSNEHLWPDTKLEPCHRKLGMEGHLRLDEQGSGDKIQCSVCEEKYDNITEYTHHLKMHLEETNRQTIDTNPNKCNDWKSMSNFPSLSEEDSNGLTETKCKTCSSQDAIKLSFKTLIQNNIEKYDYNEKRIIHQSNHNEHIGNMNNKQKSFCVTSHSKVNIISPDTLIQSIN